MIRISDFRIQKMTKSRLKKEQEVIAIRKQCWGLKGLQWKLTEQSYKQWYATILPTSSTVWNVLQVRFAISIIEWAPPRRSFLLYRVSDDSDNGWWVVVNDLLSLVVVTRVLGNGHGLLWIASSTTALDCRLQELETAAGEDNHFFWRTQWILTRVITKTLIST